MTFCVKVDCQQSAPLNESGHQAHPGGDHCGDNFLGHADETLCDGLRGGGSGEIDHDHDLHCGGLHCDGDGLDCGDVHMIQCGGLHDDGDVPNCYGLHGDVHGLH